jgi:hypothetical protein
MGEGAPDRLAFPYHRGVAPPLGVLAGLSLVEMLVVHLLVAHWWPRMALLLSLLSAAGLVWLVRLIRSFRALPVTVADGVLTMRVGTLRSVAIPVATIAGLRGDWSADSLKQPGVVNLGLLAYPNIVVDLAPPLAGRRGRAVTAVAHRLDDPDAFRGWIATLPPPPGLR